MSAAPKTPAPPRGYVSEQAKQRYTVTVGVLAAVFFLAQFLLPMVIGMAAMPMATFQGMRSLRAGAPSRGAVWQGELWYLEQSFDMAARASRYALMAVPLDGGQAREVIQPPTDDPWLAAGRDGVWIIAPDYVGLVREGQLEDVLAGGPLGEIAPPFLLDGRPAVVTRTAAGLALVKLEGGEWREAASFRLGLQDAMAPLSQEMRVLADGGRLWLLCRAGGTLFWREGLPEAGRESEGWQTIALNAGTWDATVVDGTPVVVGCSGEPLGRLAGYRLVGGQWERFLRHEVGMTGEIGVFPKGEGERLVVLRQGMPGSMRLLEVDGERVVQERRLGSGFPFPGTMMWAMAVPQLLTMALPLVLAAVLTGQMRRHRVGEYETGGVRVAFASLWRRGLAQLLDSLILGWPMLVAWLLIMRAFSDFDQFFTGGWVTFAAAFGAIAGGFLWGVGGMLVFSYLEGRYGATPGKKALGLRVVGTDLRPCGFGRAFVRNILEIVDGFLNFLVGIVVVAFTEHRQRIGDLAARTIVIDTRHPPQQAPEPVPVARVVH